MDLSKLKQEHVYMYRVDTVDWNDADIQQHMKNNGVEYYVGQQEYGDKTGKPHYQLCVIGKDMNLAGLRNIKKKSYVRKSNGKGDGTVALTKAKNAESLLSYSTKYMNEGWDWDKICTNMTPDMLSQIKPWETKAQRKKREKVERYKYILNYTKNYLKTILDDNMDLYDTTGYISDSQKQEVLIAMHKEYFNKYKTQLVRHTLIKLMIETGLMSHEEYLQHTLGKLWGEPKNNFCGFN